MTTSQPAGGCPVRREAGYLRVVGHSEVVTVVTDPETFSSGVSRFLQVPNGLDGEEHAAFRAVIDRFFTTEALAELEPRLRDVARRIVAAREERPFLDQTDLSRRAGLDARQLEALATAGAFDGTGVSRRQALWNAGWTEGEEHLEGIRVAGPASEADYRRLEQAVAEHCPVLDNLTHGVPVTTNLEVAPAAA